MLGGLADAGFRVSDLSGNELAKAHARYMVGGRNKGVVTDEVLYRFEFPERPGALQLFLAKFSTDWNISLFHYRNHGSDIGRVLVGVQVTPACMDRWQAFLDTLGFAYYREDGNEVYDQFML